MKTRNPSPANTLDPEEEAEQRERMFQRLNELCAEQALAGDRDAARLLEQAAKARAERGLPPYELPERLRRKMN
jgi:hypothetical protein